MAPPTTHPSLPQLRSVLHGAMTTPFTGQHEASTLFFPQHEILGEISIPWGSVFHQIVSRISSLPPPLTVTVMWVISPKRSMLGPAQVG